MHIRKKQTDAKWDHLKILEPKIDRISKAWTEFELICV